MVLLFFFFVHFVQILIFTLPGIFTVFRVSPTHYIYKTDYQKQHFLKHRSIETLSKKKIDERAMQIKSNQSELLNVYKLIEDNKLKSAHHCNFSMKKEKK